MKYIILIVAFFFINLNAKATDDHLGVINKNNNIQIYLEGVDLTSGKYHYSNISNFVYSYQFNEKSGIDFGKHSLGNGVSFNGSNPREYSGVSSYVKNGMAGISLQNYYLHYKYSIYSTKDTRFAIGPLAYFRKVQTHSADKSYIINNYNDQLVGFGIEFQNDDFLPWGWFFQYELKFAHGGNSGNSIIDSEMLFLHDIKDAVYGGFGFHVQKHQINNDYTHGKFQAYEIIGVLGVMF